MFGVFALCKTGDRLFGSAHWTPPHAGLTSEPPGSGSSDNDISSLRTDESSQSRYATLYKYEGLPRLVSAASVASTKYANRSHSFDDYYSAMTKDWDSIRADACRYYAEGKSLTQVQKILLRERNFKASPRAFRMRLAEWKIKRVDAGEVSSSSQRHGALHSDTVVLPDESVQDTDFEVSDSDTGTSGPIDRTPCNAAVLRSAETTLTQPEVNHKFENMLQQFRETRQSGRDVLFITGHATDAAEQARKVFPSFISAWSEDILHQRNTLLHYIATQKSASDILETLLAWMNARKADVDIKNEDHETALHLAARSGRCDNIEVLLRSGASTRATNKWGETPLHVSIRTSDKCKATLMLNTGATARDTVITGSSKRAGWCALDLAVEKVFAGFAFNVSLCSPLAHGIVPFSAYIVLRTLWTDTEKITKASKQHIRSLALWDVTVSRKLIEALEKFYEVDGFKKQLERALRHHQPSDHRTSRNLD